MSSDRWASNNLQRFEAQISQRKLPKQFTATSSRRYPTQHWTHIAELHRPSMMYGNERQQTKSITSISARTQSSRHQPDQVVWLPLLESFKQYMSKLLSLSADAITAFTNQTKTTRYSGKHASWLSIIGLTSELQANSITLSAVTLRKGERCTAKAQLIKQQQQQQHL